MDFWIKALFGTALVIGVAIFLFAMTGCAVVEVDVNIDSKAPCKDTDHAIIFGGTTECEDSDEKTENS